MDFESVFEQFWKKSLKCNASFEMIQARLLELEFTQYSILPRGTFLPISSTDGVVIIDHTHSLLVTHRKFKTFLVK